ncbi:MAG: hypothetical protein LZ172_06510 [Thaumarchaeota archaeon]|jgi:hypothetical protein|nr:hypothetical protein [Candidatus Geocrenenecus arthurdayi]MCL7391096.1 hypothetical protein [Candidatus Geocrenenecus arthurdayi]MCL7403980.1 hypothetical protein [Candidatus Geocrenenecus arthurdayi]
MNTLKSLIEILEKSTKVSVIEEAEAAVVVSEKGGRIIGIFLDNSPNLLWVHPRLEEALVRGEWNIGGLRLWVSPERNFFYANPEKFEEWFCPTGLDPAEYKLMKTGYMSLLLESRISAYDNLLHSNLEGFIRREIKLLEVSRRHLKLWIREGIIGEYVSRVNPWILAQVPIGLRNVGTVLVPVKKKSEPIHYFTIIPKDRLYVDSDHISFKIDGEMVTKLGVRPEDLRETGRGEIAYITQISKKLWSALILSSSSLPISQEDCLDTPKYNPEGYRAAIQSYNSGPESFPDVKFGEIELQLTPTMNINGRIFGTVEYNLTALIGSREELLGKVKRLLKIRKPKIYQ